MKIKAAVVNKMEDSFEIEDNIDFHEVGPTDLQILMVASKICHSDETLRSNSCSSSEPDYF
ncbi:hypothetical protein [Lactobacillus juensis]|uniref:hypothetical protein n=1 Tax=Lactobacillus TaxID=1578 RepID=UPI00351A1D3E